MNPFSETLRTFDLGNGKQGKFYSLLALEQMGLGKISRLPISIRIVLESVLRNCDGKKVSKNDVATLAKWSSKSPAPVEIPFVVARVILQDFTGVPLPGRPRSNEIDSGRDEARSQNDRAPGAG